MKIQEFEESVWKKEAIRIVIRASGEIDVADYDYERAAQQNWRVNEFIDNRIRPRIGDYAVSVIQGDGEEPHGGTILRTVRQSYKK